MSGANQAVSGGIGGFLAFFLLACALWLLMRNMNKRLRNIKYDEELEQQRNLAEAGAETLTRPPRRGGAPASGPTPASGTTSAPDDAGAAPAGGTEPGSDPLRRASAGR